MVTKKKVKNISYRFKRDTMKHKLCLLIVGLIVVLGSCLSPIVVNGQEQTDIIKAIIDSTLKRNSGINTEHYWIDFSKIDYFDFQSIEEFLIRNPNFVKVDSDSLLANDLTWKEYGFLQKTLIIFEEVEMFKDLIKIKVSKTKATDGSNGVEIIMKKRNQKYEIISSKITWIS